MNKNIDWTHSSDIKSWVESANYNSDFPIQNLPLSIFSSKSGIPRPGVLIGDCVLDLQAILHSGLLTGSAATFAEAATEESLNGALKLGVLPRKALRYAVTELLIQRSDYKEKVSKFLYKSNDCIFYLPTKIGDYTDFYAGIHHAVNVGKLFRPDHPLLPNYKHVPIGYHGRASSILPSGKNIRRPCGQYKSETCQNPIFGPTQKLDYELELGVFIGPGNSHGESIEISQAHNHIAGFCLLNDWSARDIQSWEYQPLGPFLAKSFATTISPFIITPEAMAPFYIAQNKREKNEPRILTYLDDAYDQDFGALNIELDVFLSTQGLRDLSLPAHRISRSNSKNLYWTVAQLITHHTSNGCNLRAGDLIGTGTISGQDQGTFGSLIETTFGGRHPLILETGEQRTYLEDGDEIILKARASKPNFISIGFGDCYARVSPQ